MNKNKSARQKKTASTNKTSDIENSNMKTLTKVKKSSLAKASGKVSAEGLSPLRNSKKENLKRKNLVYGGICIVVILVLFFKGIFIYAAFVSRIKEFQSLPRGQEALRVMTPNEQDFVKNKLNKLTSENSTQEMVKYMGEPDRFKTILLSSSYYYKCPELSPTCTVRIDVLKNKILRVRFLDTKRFYYEVDRED